MKGKREENGGRGGIGGVIYEIRAGQEQRQYQRQVFAASRGVLQSLEPQSVVFLPLSTFASCHVYVYCSSLSHTQIFRIGPCTRRHVTTHTQKNLVVVDVEK
jgi:hypothetical protein